MAHDIRVGQFRVSGVCSDKVLVVAVEERNSVVYISYKRKNNAAIHEISSNVFRSRFPIIGEDYGS